MLWKGLIKADRFKSIPNFSSVSAQQVMDNYFQIKLEVKTIIQEKVFKIKRENQEQSELQ